MSGQLGEFPGMREAHYAEQRDAAKIALESFATYHFESAAIMAKRLDDAQLEVKRLREELDEAREALFRLAGVSSAADARSIAQHAYDALARSSTQPTGEKEE